MRSIRIAVPLAAGALLVAGCGGSERSAGSQPGPAAGQQGRPNGGFLGGQNVGKLADAMGVSESKLQAALKSIMPRRGGNGGPPPGAGGQAPPNGTPPSGQAPDGTPPAGGAPGGPGGGQLAAQLAKKLGIPKAKVTKALQSVMARPSG